MEKVRTKKFVLAVLLAIVAFVFIGIMYWQVMENRTTVSSTDLATGWTVSVNGEILEEQEDISDYVFQNLEKGDVVIYESTLPEGAVKNDMVSILTYLSVVDVYVDDELVYSYGHTAYDKGQMVGSGYHYVMMPDHPAGKQIRMVFTLAEDNAFTNVVAPQMAKASVIYQEYFSTNMYSIVIGIFLLLLGIVLLIIGCIASVYNHSFRQLIYIGSFSFALGVWSLCNVKVFNLIGANMAATTTVEYFSLYFAAIPFALILDYIQDSKFGWRKQLIHAVAIMMSVLFAVTTILHYLNIEHYPKFLTYYHIVAAIGIILATIATINPKQKMSRSLGVVYAGIGAFIIITVLELVRFNLQKYVMQDDDSLLVSLLPVGVLILILSFILSYVFSTYDIFASTAQKELLENLAYTDMLCQTYNRAKYNEDVVALSDDGQEYAFINFDVDGLKSVNDSLGHEMGDQLLAEFAAIITQAFRGMGDLYRMGGDEFLIIIKNIKSDDVNNAMNQLEDMAQMRSADLPFSIEFSYGIVYSYEFPDDTPEQLYVQADSRMYNMKNQRKMRKKLRF